MKLEITDIQRGHPHHGPDLRTVVFCKGCPMRCPWCHSPEIRSQKPELFFRPERCFGCMECLPACPVDAHSMNAGQLWIDRESCIGCMACVDACPAGALESASRTLSVSAVLGQVLEDRRLCKGWGGLTVSGGEPTMQTEGLLELLHGAKEQGIHTCIETCGAFPPELADRLVESTDLFLYDIKDTDPYRHRENTGADLKKVVENLLRIDSLGGKSVMRCILIPKVNLNREHALALAALWDRLKNCQYIQLLPYQPSGVSKAHQLGKPAIRYREPEREDLEAFAAILTEKGIPTKLFGSLL